jgi:parallel beta-helix repeat protein
VSRAGTADDYLSGKIVISNNVSSHNGGTGIFTTGLYPAGGGNSPPVQIEVTGNTVEHNTGLGLRIAGDATSTISGNTVGSNGHQGIYANAGGSQSDPLAQVITGNEVTNNGKSGIETQPGGGATITNNIVSGNTGRGVWAKNGVHIITGNTLSFNEGGILLDDNGNQTWSHTISGNTITQNTITKLEGLIDGEPGQGTGVGIRTLRIGNSPVTIENNLITGNSCSVAVLALDEDCATITIYNPDSIDASFTVQGNNIYNNDVAYEMVVFRGVAFANIDADNNWWGTTDVVEVASKIFDWNDDSSKAMVDTSPLSAGTNSGAPDP